MMNTFRPTAAVTCLITNFYFKIQNLQKREDFYIVVRAGRLNIVFFSAPLICLMRHILML